MRIRTFFGMIAVALLLSAFGSLAGACDISNGQLACNGNCVNVSWTSNLDGCSLLWFNIERKCGPGGTWLLIGSPYGSSPYVDCGPFAGCGSGYYYRVTMFCTCNGEQSSDSIEIGPITCP